MTDRQNPLAWLPFSIAEAALSGDAAGADDLQLSAAWAHLLDRLKAAEQLVVSTPFSRNRIDYASGMRHLMLLLAVGIDKALRVDPESRSRRRAHQHRRHSDLGHGVPGLHLPARDAASR